MQRAHTLRLLLVLAALCAGAAAGIALAGLNRALFLAVNDAGARWLPAALPSCLTLLGHGLAAVLLLGVFLERAPQVLAAGLAAAPIAGALSALGKRLAGEARPAAVLDPAGFHVQGPLLSGHNAFPSGHTITIFLVAAVVLLGTDATRARTPAFLLVLGVALLVGLSRILVGAHWPTDVLGGAALGILSGIAGDLLARRWPIAQKAGGRAVFAAVVLVCALVFASIDTGYPLARPVQWALVLLGVGCAARSLFLQGGAWARRRSARGTGLPPIEP
jgi:undecaprenyl-diphosphatase